MFVKIYIAAILLVALTTLVSPLRGTYCLVFLFLCNPSSFFYEEIEQFRPIILIGGLLFFRTFFNVFIMVTKRQVLFTVLTTLFIVCSILSFMLSGKIEIWQSVQIANYLKAGVLSIVLVSFIKEKHELSIIIRILVLAAAINSIFAIYEQFNPIAKRLEESPLLYRSSGFLENANRFSSVILSIFPFAFFMYTSEKSKLLRYGAMAAIALSVAGVFCTISRLGLLTLIFVMGLISLKQSKKLQTYIILAVIVFGFLFFGAQLYRQRETVKKTYSGEIKFDSSTSMRIRLIGTALRIWIRNPLFGVGPGNFVEQSMEQLGERKRDVSRSVHNAYLHLLAEQGIAGFFLFMAIVIMSLKAASFIKQKMADYRDLAGYFQISILSWLFGFIAGTSQIDPVMWVCLTFPLISEKIYYLNEKTKTQERFEA
jgi:O-antigen ligase